MTTNVKLCCVENLMSFDGPREVIVEISDEHPASSYGVPVLVVDGQPHGPADMPDGSWVEFAKDCNGHTIDRDLREATSRAGFLVV